MRAEDRMQALLDTLGRVTTFATILCPDGISIRVLNYSGDTDGQWDKLKTVEDVNKRMDKITLQAGSRLGTILSSKVLEPMILNKAKSHSLKKPVIIVIITDGEASSDLDTFYTNFWLILLQPNYEPHQKLRDSIQDCNIGMERLGYEHASVVFLISRVGYW